jgi:hypothetical protein
MLIGMSEAQQRSLAELTKRYRKAKKDLDDARDALIAGIRRDYSDGTRQADIVREIDHEWTTEYVRKILKPVKP